jgi:hypothetical protein
MKRNIVVFGLILLGIIALSACATQPKCAAYGHYSYYEVQKTDNQKI